MQRILDSVRKQIAENIGLGEMPRISYAAVAFDNMRMPRMIPRENYERLGKLVPISWL